MALVERCLVTGADGFIGRALCRRLSLDGVRVLRMVHKGVGPDTTAADLGGETVPSLTGLRLDVVFHLAARVHQDDDGPDSEAEHQRVTVEGTRSLLAASIEAGAQDFVFFSTCGVMPVGIADGVDESAQPRPATPYARAKLAAERLVTSMNGKGGLRTVSLRLPMVYGPGHKGQFPRMIAAIRRGWFPPIPEFGGRRSVVHVDDVVDAALLVAQSPQAAGKVYIVAEPRAYTSRELYEIVLQALGRRPPRWNMPRFALSTAARLGDAGERLTRRRLPFDSEALRKLTQPAVFSGARFERELGFRPKRNLEDSVRELVSAPER